MVRLCRVPEMARGGPRASVRGSGPGEDARPALGCPSDDRRPAGTRRRWPWSHATPPPACRPRAAGVRPGPRLFSRSGECGAGKSRPGTSARSARSASWVSGCFGFTATSDPDPRPRVRPRASVLGRIRRPACSPPPPGPIQKPAPPARPSGKAGHAPRTRLRELGISPSARRAETPAWEWDAWRAAPWPNGSRLPSRAGQWGARGGTSAGPRWGPPRSGSGCASARLQPWSQGRASPAETPASLCVSGRRPGKHPRPGAAGRPGPENTPLARPAARALRCCAPGWARRK